MLLRIHNVAALPHRNERGEKTVKRCEARFVLTERVIPADCLFGWRCGFRALDRSVSRRLAQT